MSIVRSVGRVAGNSILNHPAGIGVAIGAGAIANYGMQTALETAEVAAFGREDVDRAVLGTDLSWRDIWNPIPSFLQAPPAYDVWKFRNSPVALETAFGRPNGPEMNAYTNQDYNVATRNEKRGGVSDYPYRGSNTPYAPNVSKSSMSGGNAMSASGSMVFGMHNSRR